MHEVEVQAAPLERLATILSASRAERMMATAVRARQLLADRVVWNVNATPHGGGVAEMLQVLLTYGRGAGVDTRWLTLDGDRAFFAITKRVHNALHGVATGDFDAADRAHYEQVLSDNLAGIADRVRPGDIVVLHDPQTAGLAEALHRIGAHVVWRCHIGRDQVDGETDRGWQFLRPYLEGAYAFVFSRRRYIPDWISAHRSWVIAPSIDTFSAKNRDLDAIEVGRILRRVGIIQCDGDEAISFTRRDGSHGRVRRHTGVLSGSPLPATAPLVVQVSRWDRLKDMNGVLAAFAAHVAPATPNVHLVLAGPDVSGVSDDPEGADVLSSCQAAWQQLPDAVRARCHLASIPMDDVDENAIIVNALQRHASVIVQKSLVEGFGLTVTEAMWKSRPVLASAVGGIQDQISDGVDGVLLPDPRDLHEFARRLQTLIDDQSLALRLGRAAHARVQDGYLADRHLGQYVDLFEALINGD
ncbi:MAG TPA: glycosyltransferase [Jatrophihabitantaceae bacterium]|jgi:trehalose synthase